MSDVFLHFEPICYRWHLIVILETNWTVEYADG